MVNHFDNSYEELYYFRKRLRLTLWFLTIDGNERFTKPLYGSIFNQYHECEETGLLLNKTCKFSKILTKLECLIFCREVSQEYPEDEWDTEDYEEYDEDAIFKYLSKEELGDDSSEQDIIIRELIKGGVPAEWYNE